MCCKCLAESALAVILSLIGLTALLMRVSLCEQSTQLFTFHLASLKGKFFFYKLVDKVNVLIAVHCFYNVGRG